MKLIQVVIYLDMINYQKKKGNQNHYLILEENVKKSVQNYQMKMYNNIFNTILI